MTETVTIEQLARRAIEAPRATRGRHLEVLARLPGHRLAELGRLARKPGDLPRPAVLDLLADLGPVAAPAAPDLARLIERGDEESAIAAAHVALTMGVGQPPLLGAVLGLLGAQTWAPQVCPPVDPPWAALWDRAREAIVRLDVEDALIWREGLVDGTGGELIEIHAYALLVGPVVARHLLPDVLPFLAHEELAVRREAVQIVGSAFGTLAARHAPRLADVALATDRDQWPLLESACRALGDIGTEEAVDGLRRVLRDAGGWWAKQHAITALGRCGRTAAPALADLRRILDPGAGLGPVLGTPAWRAIERIEGRRATHEDDEVFERILAIERGALAIEVVVVPEHPDDHGRYRTVDGWELDVRLRWSRWNALEEVRSPDGRRSDHADVWDLLPRSAWRVLHLDPARARELAGPVGDPDRRWPR